jgi:hypothetical protein
MNWASSETTVMRFEPFVLISSEDVTVVISSAYHVADMLASFVLKLHKNE